jgi:hypothetical protein
MAPLIAASGAAQLAFMAGEQEKADFENASRVASGKCITLETLLFTMPGRGCF